jgi:hypothetical protein
VRWSAPQPVLACRRKPGSRWTPQLETFSRQPSSPSFWWRPLALRRSLRTSGCDSPWAQQNATTGVRSRLAGNRLSCGGAFAAPGAARHRNGIEATQREPRRSFAGSLPRAQSLREQAGSTTHADGRRPTGTTGLTWFVRDRGVTGAIADGEKAGWLQLQWEQMNMVSRDHPSRAISFAVPPPNPWRADCTRNRSASPEVS